MKKNEFISFDINIFTELTLKKPKNIIENILYQGFTLLSGSPKCGKSFLSLQLALSVACGQYCLGKRVNENMKVAYLNFEDGLPRTQDRINNFLIMDNATNIRRDFSVLEVKDFNKNIDAVLEFLTDVKGAGFGLLVIDTLALMVDFTAGRGKNIYQLEYELIHSLKKKSMELKLNLLVIHHTRKMLSADGNEFTRISGTNGIGGGVDNLLILRHQGQRIILEGTGKDIESFTYDLQRNKFGFFENKGESHLVMLDEEKKQILELFAGEKELTLKEISNELGSSPSAINKKLSRLISKGVLAKSGYGKYKVNQYEKFQEF